MIVGLIASLSVAAWAYLALARGAFWRTRERDVKTPAPATWPPVTAIVPARDEAETIARSIGSLIDQDYPGEFAVILVDDESRDGTSSLARAAATARGKAERLTILAGKPLPSGWTGKLWAQIKASPKLDKAIQHRATSCSRTPISCTRPTHCARW